MDSKPLSFPFPWASQSVKNGKEAAIFGIIIFRSESEYFQHFCSLQLISLGTY